MLHLIRAGVRIDGTAGQGSVIREMAMSFPTNNNQDVSRYLRLLHGAMLGLVRRDRRDLTTRQLTTLLTIYLEDEAYSVSMLAKMLGIYPPGVTRILDRLVEEKLVSRGEDPEDRRRVMAYRTPDGARYVEEFGSVAVQVASDLSGGHLA
jgi:DNA-binding MarR family transcriptional regulator